MITKDEFLKTNPRTGAIVEENFKNLPRTSGMPEVHMVLVKNLVSPLSACCQYLAYADCLGRNGFYSSSAWTLHAKGICNHSAAAPRGTCAISLGSPVQATAWNLVQLLDSLMILSPRCSALGVTEDRLQAHSPDAVDPIAVCSNAQSGSS